MKPAAQINRCGSPDVSAISLNRRRARSGTPHKRARSSGIGTQRELCSRRLYNRGKLDETWKTYVAKNIVMHPPAGVQLDRESWLAMEKAFASAFDNIEAKVLEQVAEGDMVASRWSLTGRQKAEFMGVPSRGRTASVTGILIDRVRGDQVVEHWAELGLAYFVQVLGAN